MLARCRRHVLKLHHLHNNSIYRAANDWECLRMPECISISVALSSHAVCVHLHALLWYTKHPIHIGLAHAAPHDNSNSIDCAANACGCLSMPECISISVALSSHAVCVHPRALLWHTKHPIHIGSTDWLGGTNLDHQNATAPTPRVA